MEAVRLLLVALALLASALLQGCRSDWFTCKMDYFECEGTEQYCKDKEKACKEVKYSCVGGFKCLDGASDICEMLESDGVCGKEKPDEEKKVEGARHHISNNRKKQKKKKKQGEVEENDAE
eukprot:TRINITY_DN10042_c0_g2_i1.p1 TRINITY_DN10042_c0_g2~~TRINITY_DN10042_c0_g2_i1.p1  ORF type:complete len:121 (-),score=29.03 TRINITY_DN10042_c0_g2_i1:197-559(-)